MFAKIIIYTLILVTVGGVLAAFTRFLPDEEGEGNVQQGNNFFDDYNTFEGVPLPRKIENKTKVVLGRYFEERATIRENFRESNEDIKKPSIINLMSPDYLRAEKEKLMTFQTNEEENFNRKKLLRQKYALEFRDLHRELKDPSAKVIADTLEKDVGSELHYAAQEFSAVLFEWLDFLADHLGEYRVNENEIVFEDTASYSDYVLINGRVTWAEERYSNAQNANQ